MVRFVVESVQDTLPQCSRIAAVSKSQQCVESGVTHRANHINKPRQLALKLTQKFVLARPGVFLESRLRPHFEHALPPGRQLALTGDELEAKNLLKPERMPRVPENVVRSACWCAGQFLGSCRSEQLHRFRPYFDGQGLQATCSRGNRDLTRHDLAALLGDSGVGSWIHVVGSPRCDDRTHERMLNPVVRCGQRSCVRLTCRFSKTVLKTAAGLERAAARESSQALPAGTDSRHQNTKSVTAG